MCYIELNPVRAGMVGHPRDCPWSSHRKYACGEEGPNTNWRISHDQYLRLDRTEPARRAAYRDLFKSGLAPADIETIRARTHKGWALGNERFRAAIEALGDRRAAPAAKGRPRKAQMQVVSLV